MNKSGITPTGNRVLVKPDEAMEAYKGSIVIPDTAKDRAQLAQTTGTLIASGPTAWAEDHKDFNAPLLPSGCRVVFSKYGGLVMRGEDDEQYRLIYDDDVVALASEGVSFDV